jgi:hypothetical protein
MMATYLTNQTQKKKPLQVEYLKYFKLTIIYNIVSYWTILVAAL